MNDLVQKVVEEEAEYLRIYLFKNIFTRGSDLTISSKKLIRKNKIVIAKKYTKIYIFFVICNGIVTLRVYFMISLFHRYLAKPKKTKQVS